jgi:hypothetical protein
LNNSPGNRHFTMLRQKLFTCILLLLPCWLIAQSADSIAPPQIDFITQVKPRLDSNALNYTTLGLKMKVDYDDKANAQSFSVSGRLKKDSIAWMAFIGPLNIEVARAVATPDSFRLMNKLGEEYTVKPLSFLQDWLFLPFNFPMLQQLLAGEVIDITPKATMVEVYDTTLAVYFESDKIQEKVVLNKGSYTISQIVLKDKMIQQNMLIKFEAYNLLNGKPFSYKRNIEISRGTYLLKMDIEITRATVNETLSYPFDIPERYKRVE